MVFLRYPEYGLQRFVTFVTIVTLAMLRYGFVRKIFYNYDVQQLNLFRVLK